MNKMPHFLSYILFFLLTLTNSAQSRIYVNASAASGGDGTSWATAYNSLQSALIVANTEIWIASGTYKPDVSDENIRFTIPSNTTLLGGFNGSETLASQRDWNANPTILSGDLNNSNAADAGDSHTIMLIQNNNVVLDGLIFEHGYADNVSISFGVDGGAMYATNSFQIQNSIFRNNYAQDTGGAIAITGVSSSLENVLFYGNTSGLRGGAVYMTNNDGILLTTNATFYNNTSTEGGGLEVRRGTGLIYNSIFTGNSGSPANMSFSLSGTGVIYNSLLDGTMPTGLLDGGANLFNTDPLFIDAASANFTLAALSPAIDSGNNNYVNQTKDLGGNDRIIPKNSDTAIVDMGAYETLNPCLPFTDNRIYVNAAATGSNDGSSWANAFTDLQDALSVSNCVYEIWVAAGTYIPHVSDSQIRFVTAENTKLLGGFNGTETLASQRDWNVNPTILSGDLDNSGTHNIGDSTFIINSSGDNTTFDGLIIEFGYSLRSSPAAGIYNTADNIQIKNCVFRNNFCFNGSSGVFNYGGTNIDIVNSVFHDNFGLFGVAIQSRGSGIEVPDVINVTNCTITKNSADSGLSIHVYGQTIINVYNTIFDDNYNSSSTSEEVVDVNERVNVYHSITSSSTSNMSCSNGNIINQSAQFVDSDTHDYRLQSNSPAIDSGDNSYISEPLDFLKNPRIIAAVSDGSPTVDMGAVENTIVGLSPYVPINGIVYVNASATGNNRGESWANAFTTLQEALLQVSACIDEIWVAKGTYKPDTSDENIPFLISKKITLLGGFNGTETLASQRDWYANSTILSGDLNNSDTADAGDSHTIILVQNNDVVIDGFIFEHGYADDNSVLYGQHGGAMYVTGSVDMQNCIFRNNYALNVGGAVTTTGLQMRLENTLFYNNTGNELGGGIYVNNDAGTIDIVNATFWGNTSAEGGGIDVRRGTANIYNSIFAGNSGTLNNISFSLSGTGTLYNSLLDGVLPAGLTDGGGNLLNTAPLFSDSSSNDFTLSKNSPAINSGGNFESLTQDLAGNSRIISSAIDMGAYEFDAFATTWLGTVSSDWNDVANWSNGLPDSITNAFFTFEAFGDVEITAQNAMVKDLVVNNAYIQIRPTGALHISGDLYMDDNGGEGSGEGTIKIYSDATQTGALLLEGESREMENLSYEQYLTTSANPTDPEGWHLIAVPFENEYLINLAYSVITNGNKYAIATYDNSLTDNRYEYFTDSSGNNDIVTAGKFDAGKGYSVKKATDGTVDYSGDLRTDNVVFMLTDNASGGGNKWNLIGNPFMAPLSLNDQADATNNFLRVNATKLNPARVAIYKWNSTITSYEIYNQATAGASYISVGEGFFVEAATGGGTIEFTEAMQTLQTNAALSKSANSIPEIYLSISDGSATKKTQVKYLAGTTTGLDVGYDAGTFSGTSSTFGVFTHLVSDSEGVDFGLQCLPNNDFESMVIPVGIKAAAQTKITITANVLNLPTGVEVYLEDKVTHTFTNLNQEEYSFTSPLALDGIGRFFLHTSSKALSVATDFVVSNISMYQTSPENLRIVGIPNGITTLALFDVLGKQILENSFEAKGVHDVALPYLKTGVYIIRLQTTQGIKSKKIIVN
ncbi:choice-of-anchor Q domain-containing protein [uncultured Polaribacter sp.]|uniref:choice-of-anchor Q domain-containing protein n=1 Tax=uncultured Polaribacter sp. TaxID=174711 RepID=UPI00261657A8|nr:choice-of-anchor Q domain-containing protein [uncultured Polaribacter sp.]